MKSTEFILFYLLSCSTKILPSTKFGSWKCLNDYMQIGKKEKELFRKRTLVLHGHTTKRHTLLVQVVKNMSWLAQVHMFSLQKHPNDPTWSENRTWNLLNGLFNGKIVNLMTLRMISTIQFKSVSASFSWRNISFLDQSSSPSSFKIPDYSWFCKLFMKSDRALQSPLSYQEVNWALQSPPPLQFCILFIKSLINPIRISKR